MKRVINHLREYVSKCSECQFCRNGSCVVLGLYKQSVLLSLFSGNETYEERVVCIHQEIDDSGCDQIAFADLIDRLDRELRLVPIPANYPALAEVLDEIKLLQTWVGRMSKNRRLLLSDTVGAAIEHILAYLDYSYLELGLDLERLLVNAFPNYKRTPVLQNCNYPESSVIRYTQRARVFHKEFSEDGFDMISLATYERPGNSVGRPAVKDLPTICDGFFDEGSPFHRGNVFLPDKKLTVSATIPNYPRCGEREIDQLAVYHSALPDINRYLEEALVDSFQNKCRQIVLSTKSRIRDNWFARVIKSLDFLYGYSTENNEDFLTDLVLLFFETLELELNMAAGIGHVWNLCVQKGNTTLAIDYYWELGRSQEIDKSTIKERAPRKRRQVDEKKLEALQPYLNALIKNKFIRNDYSWIRTKEDKKNGHDLYGAAWIAHIFRVTLKIPQVWTGDLFKIKDISTYLEDIDLKDASKEAVEAVFLSANLTIEY